MIFGKNKKRFRPQPEALFATVYYTIPRTVRELQPGMTKTANLAIIPYQELLGNYNFFFGGYIVKVIIPYQELLGNYNEIAQQRKQRKIIPYQELLGNYNSRAKTCL